MKYACWSTLVSWMRLVIIPLALLLDQVSSTQARQSAIVVLSPREYAVVSKTTVLTAEGILESRSASGGQLMVSRPALVLASRARWPRVKSPSPTPDPPTPTPIPPTPTPVPPTPTPTSTPASGLTYTIANDDSVMVQAGTASEVRDSSQDTPGLTTGQSVTYGWNNALAQQNLTTNGDWSLVKCNGGNPNGNGKFYTIPASGDLVTVYCMGVGTPTPTPAPGTPTPHPTATPAPSATRTPTPPTPTPHPTATPAPSATATPIAGCPVAPPSLGTAVAVNPGDPTGGSDSSSAFQSALDDGDNIKLTSGTYLLNDGVSLPSNAQIQCTAGAGVVLKQTVMSAGVMMIQMNGGTGQTIAGCNFEGPNYNWQQSGGVPDAANYFEDFIHINNDTSVQIINNTFNGEWGYTGAIDLEGDDGVQENQGDLTECNTFTHCGYYAEQLSVGTNVTFAYNSLTDCAGWVEAADSGSVVSNSIAHHNTMTMVDGVGCVYTGNCGADNYWTCGHDESGNAFNYSSNYCHDNVVSGSLAYIAVLATGGTGDSAQYCNDTMENGATIDGTEQWSPPCPSTYP